MVDGEDVRMEPVIFALEKIVGLASGVGILPFSFDSGVIAVEQILINLISEFAWEWKVWAFFALSPGDGQAGHSRDRDVEGRRRSAHRRIFSHDGDVP